MQIERLVRGLELMAQRLYPLGRQSDEDLAGKGRARSGRSGHGRQRAAGHCDGGPLGTAFAVQTGDGVLRVYEVQIPGKKRMDTGAFLRGYTMEPGTVLLRESDQTVPVRAGG